MRKAPYSESVRVPPLLPRHLGLCTAALFALTSSRPLTAAPVVAGLEGNHPLDQAATGLLLIDELRCAACHDGISSSNPPSAPLLNEAQSRLRPDFVEAFIKNPAAHHPGTAMPDVLGGRTDAERAEIASSIAHYVLSLSTKSETPEMPETQADPKAGKELYHTTGCIACHAPHDPVPERSTGVGLDHLGKKYTTAGLAAFLHSPLEVRPSGRMPEMGLTRRESADLTAYLLQRKPHPPGTNRFDPDPKRIEEGRRAFTEMNCAACHSSESEGTSPAAVPVKPPAAKDLDLTKGCLSETPGKAPNYGLSKAQKEAIRSALSAPPTPLKAEQTIAQRLTALNCIACHQRDDFGGVAENLNPFFQSTEEALGDSARIPPTLTLIGAKLRPEWMNKVLYDGERVRPYMTTRMPQYGREALKGLTEQFGEIDSLPVFDFKPIEQESNPMMRDGAHMLLGINGLNCIACHNYNGKEGPGMKGMDLMTSYQRLQPAWFDQFMRNPASLRPGIIMPSFWPDGQAVQTEILNGNTEDQLRALWYHFSLGHSARDPDGLGDKDPKLVVTNTIRTYRGRSNVAGYRGIAVGYPGGLSYAFNAQTGALSAIWLGEFVTVGWRGQGSGNFNPIGRAVQLPNDVGLLPKPADPWPLHPVRTKDNPVNPDPLYPRQHGYAFRGYQIAKDGRPTFSYKLGDVVIEDSAVALTEQTPVVLSRTLRFTTKENAELHLRPLKGKISADSETSFTMGSIQLTIADKALLSDGQVSSQLRPSADGEKELLIHFRLPAGTSSCTIDYAVQP